MKTGNVNLNKDGINPIMGNIKPSFLHIHSLSEINQHF